MESTLETHLEHENEDDDENENESVSQMDGDFAESQILIEPSGSQRDGSSKQDQDDNSNNEEKEKVIDVHDDDGDQSIASVESNNRSITSVEAKQNKKEEDPPSEGAVQQDDTIQHEQQSKVDSHINERLVIRRGHISQEDIIELAVKTRTEVKTIVLPSIPANSNTFPVIKPSKSKLTNSIIAGSIISQDNSTSTNKKIKRKVLKNVGEKISVSSLPSKSTVIPNNNNNNQVNLDTAEVIENANVPQSKIQRMQDQLQHSKYISNILHSLQLPSIDQPLNSSQMSPRTIVLSNDDYNFLLGEVLGTVYENQPWCGRPELELITYQLLVDSIVLYDNKSSLLDQDSAVIINTESTAEKAVYFPNSLALTLVAPPSPSAISSIAPLSPKQLELNRLQQEIEENEASGYLRLLKYSAEEEPVKHKKEIIMMKYLVELHDLPLLNFFNEQQSKILESNKKDRSITSNVQLSLQNDPLILNDIRQHIIHHPQYQMAIEKLVNESVYFLYDDGKKAIVYSKHIEETFLFLLSVIVDNLRCNTQTKASDFISSAHRADDFDEWNKTTQEKAILDALESQMTSWTSDVNSHLPSGYTFYYSKHNDQVRPKMLRRLVRLKFIPKILFPSSIPSLTIGNTELNTNINVYDLSEEEMKIQIEERKIVRELRARQLEKKAHLNRYYQSLRMNLLQRILVRYECYDLLALLTENSQYHDVAKYQERLLLDYSDTDSSVAGMSLDRLQLPSHVSNADSNNSKGNRRGNAENDTSGTALAAKFKKKKAASSTIITDNAMNSSNAGAEIQKQSSKTINRQTTKKTK